MGLTTEAANLSLTVAMMPMLADPLLRPALRPPSVLRDPGLATPINEYSCRLPLDSCTWESTCWFRLILLFPTQRYALLIVCSSYKRFRHLTFDVEFLGRVTWNLCCHRACNIMYRDAGGKQCEGSNTAILNMS